MRRLYVLGTILSVFAAAQNDPFLPGLEATLSDTNRRVEVVVPTPNFHLRADESIHPSLAPAFAAEWRGLISILQTGTYAFECDGAQVSIDGKPVTGQPVQLSSGRHPLRIQYERKAGDATLQLQWRSPQFPLEPVPASLLSHRAPTGATGRDALVERGRRLVEDLGCANCHRTASASPDRPPGPRLTGIGSRVRSSWLVRWLENPSAYRSGAMMPAMLDDQQRRDVASYLASLKGSPASAAKPTPQDIDRGKQLYASLGCASCHDQEGLSLAGVGSKMEIGPLAAYLKDPAKVDPSGRMPSMLLTSDEAMQLASFLAESKNPAFEQPAGAGDPVRGKALIGSHGCLACHALDDPKPPANEQQAPDLETLTPERGCLATTPRGVPRYRLARDERAAIQAFLGSYRRHPDVAAAPVYTFRRKVEQLRCTACHQIDHLGPSVPPSEAVPPLTDAGAKLRTGWIEQVLTNRKRVRAWPKIRMPHYEPLQVASLAEGFARAAGVPSFDGLPAPPSNAAARARGAGMLGTNAKNGGMACIGCHDWGSNKSLGEDGPQLINAAERLRYDWYHRWMLNPARILSGTSMPNYFTSMKREQADSLIHALWAALSMGDRLPLPEGFKPVEAALGSEARPVPDREAIVVRWDMPEATPAAIAVGLPGGISYCFDAGESRLRYAWDGGFLDLSGTLLRKVDQNRLTPTAELIGEIFYRSNEFPLRVGEVGRIPQRRFRGYRLVEGHPQFHYQVDGVDVYERIVPAKNQKGLTREFTIQRVDRPMWFVSEAATQRIPQGTNVRFDIAVAR